MAATRIIPMHINKGKTVSACLKARVEYAKNGEKTEQGRFVSSYECNPETADQEFLLSRSAYKRKTGRQYKGDVIAYQLRQSFKPGEITPEEANQIGYETAMRFTKGRHAFIVCTHTDRPHIHNHIIFNSVNLDADRKFKNSWLSYIGLRTLSDIICLEHGMSVIVPRKFAEQDRGSRYHNVSFRQMLRAKIDEIMNDRPDSFEKFLDKLHEQGYEIKCGKHTAVKGKDQKRFIRLDSLGEGYTEEELRRELDGEPHESEEKESSKTPKKKRNFEYLIDIPTLKSIESSDTKSHQASSEDKTGFFTPNSSIDFSGVKVEDSLEDQVDFDTFCKSDFRAVKVKDCVAVPKSKKLLQFTLDDGTGTERTILSGIHKWYEPEDLIGKTLVAIVNLPPRKMMGIDSCGMIISAVDERNGEEELHVLMVDNHIPAGAKMC